MINKEMESQPLSKIAQNIISNITCSMSLLIQSGKVLCTDFAMSLHTRVTRGKIKSFNLGTSMGLSLRLRFVLISYLTGDTRFKVSEHKLLNSKRIHDDAYSCKIHSRRILAT